MVESAIYERFRNALEGAGNTLKYVTQHPSFSVVVLSMIQTNPHFHWSLQILKLRNLRTDGRTDMVLPFKVIAHHHGERDYLHQVLSWSSGIPWRFVKENPDLPWDWQMLCARTVRGIPSCDGDIFDVIRTNRRRPWPWKNMNPCRKIRRKYWYLPWQGHMTYARIRAARVIQRLWLDKYYNPERTCCKNRLAREFREMSASLTLRL